MLIVAVVLYALSAILALLASVGIDHLGLFAVSDLALACLGAGLLACHVPPVRTHG